MLVHAVNLGPVLSIVGKVERSNVVNSVGTERAQRGVAGLQTFVNSVEKLHEHTCLQSHHSLLVAAEDDLNEGVVCFAQLWISHDIVQRNGEHHLQRHIEGVIQSGIIVQ